MTANIELHPPGDGEGLRLIRTAEVDVKCDFCDGKGKIPEGQMGSYDTDFTSSPRIYSAGDTCPRCHGTGTYPQTVRVDICPEAIEAIYGSEWAIQSDNPHNPYWIDIEDEHSIKQVLTEILKRYAAGESVPGVTPVEVRDDGA